MCLILKEEEFSEEEIIDLINFAFRKLRNRLARLEKMIDLFPFAYQFVEKWNRADSEKHTADGSIQYDFIRFEEGKIEYNVTKCMYVEAFSAYGIKSLSRIFCLTDNQNYANLSKHVRFQRYSTLCDGDSCHDVITRKS